MKFGEKILENLSSIKFWAFVVASVFRYIDKIDVYTWAGITIGLMGAGRVFEYFANRKNGNGK